MIEVKVVEDGMDREQRRRERGCITCLILFFVVFLFIILSVQLP